ncbi:DUF6651 domain-containing protein [Sodalis sp. RH16]|uniref:DUF6651 domain-containing protein n=1 Tax=Sodalis sp. RH16 TaxID=3394331 RepID=UPI0039B5BA6A
MKLKLDENGHAVLVDGNPVYVHADGKEVPFDAAGTVETIKRLNGEAKSHRERAEAAEAKLKTFDGIESVEAALKAIETVKNFDDKKLVEAGEVERVKTEAVKAYEGRLTEQEKRHAEELSKISGERDTLQSTLFNERIGGQFDRSPFIKEKLIIPSDMARAAFGNAFKIEDGKIVAYDPSGNRIFSRVKPGELAGFDEAIETLVDNYPNRDYILKGSNSSGSGAHGGLPGGKRTVTRAQFDGLSAAEQAAVAASANKGEVSIVD